MVGQQKADRALEGLIERYTKDIERLEQQEDEAKRRVSQLEEVRLQLEELLFRMPKDSGDIVDYGCDMSRIAPLINLSRNEIEKWLGATDYALEEAHEEKRRATRRTDERHDQYKVELYKIQENSCTSDSRRW
jgi:chromosome segregation ATPase